MKVSALLLLLLIPAPAIQGFIIAQPRTTVSNSAGVAFAVIPRKQRTAQQLYHQRVPLPLGTLLFSSPSNDDDDDGDIEEASVSNTNVNPYADPNYPDLEFVNYDDPEYAVEQGEDGFGGTDDEELLEAMREDRRRRNDEYQFQTYWTDVWGAGEASYKGEWTVYYSSTFFPDDDSEEEGEEEASVLFPRLVQTSEAPLSVVSRAFKELVELAADADADKINSNSNKSYFAVDAERIVHSELLEQPMGDADLAAAGTDDSEQHVLRQTYWPDALAAIDFRGHQGIMVCGNAWTICTAVPLTTLDDNADADTADDVNVGPFSEYRVEVGIQADGIRFRVKFDYSVIADSDSSAADDYDDISTLPPPPPLHLKTMTVCREAANQWPRSSVLADSLFGAPGATGGLYDPPPVGEQAAQYCLVDLEGGATVLFPVIMDQGAEDDDSGSSGWVTSLDWTAGPMRYQVDRKVHGGANLRGLRTLELSEVQGANADQYRPRDGGQNMRQ